MLPSKEDLIRRYYLVRLEEEPGPGGVTPWYATRRPYPLAARPWHRLVAAWRWPRPSGAGPGSRPTTPDEPEGGRPGFGEARQGRRPRRGGRDDHARDRAGHPARPGLARPPQNADGSFGNGTYRGNIAVTSLAGLAFMASGSSPGRGPYGDADRPGPGLRHGQHVPVGLHRGRRRRRPTARCTPTASAPSSWPRPTG